LLLGTPDLPSSDGGVLCGGGGLLVEKMNSVDFFFLDKTGSMV
jgi:cation transport ATPase